MLKIDYNTEGFEKARFTRLAVKLDLTKPLISKINIDGLLQLVEYEGLPTICYGCGRYGHLEEACSLRAQVASTQKTPATPQATDSVSMEQPAHISVEAVVLAKQAFGDWMQVKPHHGRPSKAARRDGPSSFPSGVRDGSRFTVLDSLERVDDHRTGNPRTEDIKQHNPISWRAPTMKATKTVSKDKSTTSNDIPSVPPAGTSKTGISSGQNTSIFASTVYKESYIPMSLGPAHAAVILSPSIRMGRTPNELAESSHRPTVSSRIGVFWASEAS